MLERPIFKGIARRFGWANQSMGRLLIGCMVIGFASLSAAGIAAIWSTSRNQEHIRAVNHTYEVRLAIARANILVEQADRCGAAISSRGSRTISTATKGSRRRFRVHCATSTR